MLSPIFKTNPYHDEKGRFSSKDKGKYYSSREEESYSYSERVARLEAKRKRTQKTLPKGVRFDADLNAEPIPEDTAKGMMVQWANMLGGSERREDGQYPSMQAFLLVNGEVGKIPSSPPPIDLMKVKDCYRNATVMAVFENPDKYEYTEGVVVTRGVPIPIEHAYLTDRKTGEVVDPTLGWRPDASYFGVRIPKEIVAKSASDTGWYGVLTPGGGAPSKLARGVHPDFPYKDKAKKSMVGVFKANPYRDAKMRFTTKEKSVHTISMGVDMEKQMAWLQQRAKEHGKSSVDQLMMDNPQVFGHLAKEWRRYHAYKGLAFIIKANPYHDEHGRFTTKDKAVNVGPDVVQLTSQLKKEHGVSVEPLDGKLEDSLDFSDYGDPISQADKVSGRWGHTLQVLQNTLDDMESRLGVSLKTKRISLLERDPATKEAHAMAGIGSPVLTLSPALMSEEALTEARTSSLNYTAGTNRQWGALDHYLGTSGKIAPESREEFVQGVIRHELGHILTTPQVSSQFKKTMIASGRNRGWVKDNVSIYGAQDSNEAIAEMFSVYTDKSYKSGKYPKDLEDLMEKMLKPVKTSKVKKLARMLSWRPYILAGKMKDVARDDDGWDDKPVSRERSPEDFPKG